MVGTKRRTSFGSLLKDKWIWLWSLFHNNTVLPNNLPKESQLLTSNQTNCCIVAEENVLHYTKKHNLKKVKSNTFCHTAVQSYSVFTVTSNICFWYLHHHSQWRTSLCCYRKNIWAHLAIFLRSSQLKKVIKICIKYAEYGKARQSRTDHFYIPLKFPSSLLQAC